ncbi:MAG: reverse transcriptase N-terminal domain-containing protein [Potamolinea sp.]
MTTLEMEVDNWKALPWKRFQQIVFRLQTMIFKARKNGDRKLVTIDSLYKLNTDSLTDNSCSWKRACL